MSFVRLDEPSQKAVDSLYEMEKIVTNLVDEIEKSGIHRWLSIGRTDIEKGFMSLRKGVAELYKTKHIAPHDAS